MSHLDAPARLPVPESNAGAPPAPPWTLRRAALLWLLCTSIAALYGWWIRPNAGDDAMIYLRYVRNVLDGHGWVYNPGEWVNGSTSTGNTLALLLLSWITGRSWFLAQILVFALGVGSALFAVIRLFAAEGRVPAVLAGALVLATPLLGWTLGMDTPLLLGCAALATLHFRDRRYRLCGLWLGLLCLTRPDGVFLVLALLVGFFARHGWKDVALRRRLLQGIGLFAVVQLPWYGYSLATFGELLPQTLGAKLAQVEAGVFGEPPVFVRGFHEQAMWVLQGILRPLDLFPSLMPVFWQPERWPSRTLYTLVQYYLLFAVLGTYLCALAGTTIAALSRHAALPLIVWGGLHFVAYALLGLGVYAWYYVPLTFAMTMATAVLATRLWRLGRRGGTGWIARAAALGLVVCFVFVHFPQLSRSSERYAHYPQYLEAARWFEANTPAGSSVACCEIGVLGFEMPNHVIVDMWGLVNLEGAAAVQQGRFDWWLESEPRYVLVHHPAWAFIEAQALQRPEFQSDYRLLGRIHTEGRQELLVFERRF